MGDSEEYVRQANEWLAEEDAKFTVRLYIDLPDLGWIVVTKVVANDGELTCDYLTGSALFPRAGTLLCPVSRVLAARRVEEELEVPY